MQGAVFKTFIIIIIIIHGANSNAACVFERVEGRSEDHRGIE